MTNSTNERKQELFTVVSINGSPYSPITVMSSEQNDLPDQPGVVDLEKACDLLREAYGSRHSDPRDRMIILGMFDTIKTEIAKQNLNYQRSISLGDVTLHYFLQTNNLVKVA